MSIVDKDLDFQGLTDFLMENPCYRLKARYYGVYRQDDDFWVGVSDIHSTLDKPLTQSNNLSLALYRVSETLRNLSHDDLKNSSSVSCVSDSSLQDPPENEMFPNLAEFIRENRRGVLMYAQRAGGRIKASLATYYRGGDSGYSPTDPREIIYMESPSFQPEILEMIIFPKHNVETLFTGIETEVMLRNRDERLKQDK